MRDPLPTETSPHAEEFSGVYRWTVTGQEVLPGELEEIAEGIVAEGLFVSPDGLRRLLLRFRVIE